MSRRLSILLTILFSVIGVSVAGLLVVRPWETSTPQRTPKLPPGLSTTLTISKEITHVTGPVRRDGTIDYLEALNRRDLKGVTRENNAAIPFLSSFSPADAEIDARWMKAVFKRFSVVSSQAGDSATNDPDHVIQPGPEANWLSYEDGRKVVLKRPWTREDFPQVAIWIDTNAEPLAQIAEGLEREEWYVPRIVLDSEELFEVVRVGIPLQKPVHRVGKLLVSNAMLAIGEKRDADAVKSLLTLHRLATHLGSTSQTVLEFLLACQIDALAREPERHLIARGRLTDQQWVSYREALSTFPGFRSIDEVLNFGSRLEMLDMVSTIQQGFVTGEFDPFERLSVLGGNTEPAEYGGAGLLMTQFFGNRVIDWNISARCVNEVYDDLWRTTQTENREERLAARVAFLERLHRRAPPIQQPDDPVFSKMAEDYRKLSEAVADLLISLFVPTGLMADDAFDRLQTRQQLRTTGIALARYQLAEGHYPQTLAELIPIYLPEQPRDPYGIGLEATLVYRPEPDGFRLSTIGKNGRDDGGNWDYSQSPPLDDHNLTIPVPPEDD